MDATVRWFWNRSACIRHVCLTVSSGVLSHTDQVKFFKGYPTTEVLTSKMDKLLGITDTDGQAGSDDGVRNPPWVWCCLKSYYLDENNPRGSRRYRIFSTTLVGWQHVYYPISKKNCVIIASILDVSCKCWNSLHLGTADANAMFCLPCAPSRRPCIISC